MVNLRGVLRLHAVKRMYELGLEEQDILKIFVRYDTEALVDTLKHYKYVTKRIPKEYFYAKLNSKQGWSMPKSRGRIFKNMAGHMQDVWPR